MSMYNEDTQFNAMNKRIAQLEAERKIDKDILFKQDQTIQLRNTTIAQLEAENAELRLEAIAATGQAQTALEENAKLNKALNVRREEANRKHAYQLELEAENAKLREAIDNALLCDTAVQMSEALQEALLGDASDEAAASPDGYLNGYFVV